MKTVVLLCTVLLATSGQTAPSQAARHLDYSFAVSSTDNPAGGTGTMHIDILGRAKNGGIIVRTNDDWLTPLSAKTANHPAVDCEIYDSGNVVCMKYPIEGGQVSLLPFLASGLPRAINAGKGIYTVEEQPGREWDYSEQLDGQPTQSGDNVQMVLKGTENDAGNQKDRVAATVMFDATTLIPTDLSIETRQFPYDAGAWYSTVKVHLLKDSGATPGGS